MSDFLDAMEALAGAFSGITGLQRHAFPPGELGTVPAVVVSVGDGEFGNYSPTMDDDVTDLDLVVTVFVQWGETRAAWQKLTPFIAPAGTSSLIAAVNADTTLAAVVDSVLIGRPRNLGPYTWGATRYLGAEFPVEVFL
jgi:hypothetical protein